MSEKDTLVKVENLSVIYKTDEATIYAVNDFSFELNKGEILGLVGETGAGKTTVALSIMGLISTPPGIIKNGKILFDNEDLLRLPKSKMRKIRGKKISMIFQDPMSALNPIDTVGKQISEVIRIHQKLSRKKAMEKAGEMLEMVGIPGSRCNEYPHQFSGGMKQRIVIAMALACNPELLIADEPTTALDVTIQAQVLELMKDLKKKLNTSIILISHDLGVIAEMCSRVAVMYAGEVLEMGEAIHVFDEYMHPYTEGLFGTLPNAALNSKRLKVIPGHMADPRKPVEGCSFAPRCKYASAACLTDHPQLQEVTPGHYVRCHHKIKGKEVAE